MSQHNSSVLVGGYPLSGRLQGAHYGVERLSGWWERPQTKRSAISRELADGDYPVPWNFQPRYITIAGHVQCADHGQMHHIMDQLNGLCATQREWLSVQGHGPLQSALVEVDDQPLLTPLTDQLLKFVLYFKANDSRKYGESRAATASNLPPGESNSVPVSDWVPFHQYGNYPNYPVIDIETTGAYQGFRLVMESGGQSHTWQYTAGSFSFHETQVHMRTGQIFVDGVEQSSRLSSSNIWAVQPRQSHRFRVERVGDQGQIHATVRFRDTWI